MKRNASRSASVSNSAVKELRRLVYLTTLSKHKGIRCFGYWGCTLDLLIRQFYHPRSTLFGDSRAINGQCNTTSEAHQRPFRQLKNCQKLLSNVRHSKECEGQKSSAEHQNVLKDTSTTQFLHHKVHTTDHHLRELVTMLFRKLKSILRQCDTSHLISLTNCL